jgi:hypothetical protein
MESLKLLTPYRINLKYIKKISHGQDYYIYFSPRKNMKFLDYKCITLLYKQKSYSVNFDIEPKKIIIPSKKKSGRREIYEYTQLISEEHAMYISFRINPETQIIKSIIIKHFAFLL